MRPSFSEFTYGFALTDELIHHDPLGITAVPIFPSLYEEGRANGGYDVLIERMGLPLFLQFKVSHCMVSANAREAQQGYFITPYYRMHLRPVRYSNQHQMLVDLEQEGHEVYYIAPGFHRLAELTDAYFNNRIRRNSIWIRPLQIGSLPDGDDHSIAFQLPSNWRFCSNSKKGEGSIDYAEASDRIRKRLEQSGDVLLSRSSIERLSDTLYQIARTKPDVPPIDTDQVIERLRDWHPLARVSFLATNFLDANLFIVSQG